MVICAGGHTHYAPAQFVTHPAVIQIHHAFALCVVETCVQAEADIFQFIAGTVVREVRLPVTGKHTGPPVFPNGFVPTQ